MVKYNRTTHIYTLYISRHLSPWPRFDKRPNFKLDQLVQAPSENRVALYHIIRPSAPPLDETPQEKSGKSEPTTCVGHRACP